MTAYLNYTRKVAEATPAARNRIIDFWRAAAGKSEGVAIAPLREREGVPFQSDS